MCVFVSVKCVRWGVFVSIKCVCVSAHCFPHYCTESKYLVELYDA